MGCTNSLEAAAPHDAQSVESFHARYSLAEKLGEGAFGQVRAVRQRKGAEEALAVKVIKAEQSSKLMKMVQNEHRTWKRAGSHQNIVRLDGFFVESGPMHVAMFLMERCDGCLKAMLGQLAVDQALREASLQGMLSAISHLHARGIVHRDVKFDNFLIFGDLVKLCDFGVAAVVPACGYLTSVAGTAPYMAVEVVQAKPYGVEVDVWSCGVCMYFMLFQDFPYKPQPGQKGAQAFKEAIVAGKEVSFKTKQGSADAESQALVAAMLDRNPKTRPTADDALRASFFNQTMERKQSVAPSEVSTCYAPSSGSESHA